MQPATSVAIARRRILAMSLLALATFPLHAQDERPVIDDRSVSKETAASEKLPTLWIAGDSTVRSNNPMRGWGQDLGTFFDSGENQRRQPRHRRALITHVFHRGQVEGYRGRAQTR